MTTPALDPTPERGVNPVAAAALLAVLCLVLHGRALGSGWKFDDGPHLYFVERYAPWQYFASPEVMREQSFSYVTPWNPLFYELGLPFFGLEPRGHYAHLLLVLWGTAVATFRLLRRWLGGWVALTGAGLFLAMPPTAVVAQSVTTGHYAYGLLFAVLAIHGFAASPGDDRARPRASVAVLYALACLCKELYVPLVAVLLSLPRSRTGTKLARAWPLLVVAAAYVVLRLVVLGGVGGMPGEAGPPSNPGVPWIARALGPLAGLNSLVLGAGASGWVALGLVLVIAVRGWRRPRGGSRAFWSMCVAAVVVPLVPVSTALFAADPMQGRVAFVLGWSLALLLAWLLHGPRHGLALALVLGAFLAIGQRITFDIIRGRQGRMEAQNGFLVRAGEGEVLVPHEASSIGHLRSMALAVALRSGRPPTPVVVDEEGVEALGEERGRRAWTWDEQLGHLRVLGPDYDRRVELLRREVATARGRPLAIELTLEIQGRARVLRWTMTGCDGRPLMIIHEIGRHHIPYRGEVRFEPSATLVLGTHLHVRFVHAPADGGEIRSPLFALPTDRSTQVQWSSPGPDR